MKDTGGIEIIEEKPAKKNAVVNNVVIDKDEPPTKPMVPEADHLPENQAGKVENSAENPAENPEQFSRLKRWFGILRQVCQEKPRLVLKSLQNPKTLIEKSPDDALAVQAEKFRWTTIDQERARIKFEKKGIDPDKAIGVINFLRNHAQQSYYPRDKNGLPDIDRRFQANYQYDFNKDFKYISELVSLNDDPVGLLENIKNIVVLDEFFSLKDLVDYTKSVAGNPRANEILSQIKLLKNTKKINVAYNLKLVEGENGKVEVYLGSGFGHEPFIVEPLQSFAKIDEKTYQELTSQENMLRVQELWTRLAGEQPLELQFLPGLVKLAHNPQLELLFLKTLEANGGYVGSNERRFGEQFLWYSHADRFDWTISRLEQMLQAVPEIFDLLDNGFVLHRDILRINYENFERATDISELIERKEELVAAANDSELMLRASILKKHGLQMPMVNVSQDYLNFVRTSDPDRLEKALTIYEVAKGVFNTDLVDNYYSDMHKRFDIWRKIGDEWANFSVTDIAEIFELANKHKDVLANYNLLDCGLLDNLDSIDTLRQRVQALINPETQTILRDNIFNDFLKLHSGYEMSSTRLQALMKNPEAYLALYAKKDLFYQRVQALINEKVNVFGDLFSFYRLVQFTEDEFNQLKKDLSSAIDYKKIPFWPFTVQKFDLLSNFNEDEKENLLKNLKSLGVESSTQSLYELNLDGLEKYISLSDAERQQVFDLAQKLFADFNLLITDRTDSNKLYLDFYADLINNPQDQQLFFQYLNLHQQYFLQFLNNLDKSSHNKSDISKYMHLYANYFRQLLNNHQGEADFVISEYIDQEGVIKEKFLQELLITTHLSEYAKISILLSDQSLAKMDEKDQRFWTYWRQSRSYLCAFLLEHRADFDRLVVNGVATEDLIIELLSIKQNDLRHNLIDSLLEDPQVLANMSEDSRQFWTYWKNKKFPLQDFLIKRREDFNKFVIDGVATETLLIELFKLEQNNTFMMNEVLRDPQVLANMSEDSRQFWAFWQNGPPYLEKVLMNNRERFNEFVKDNQPTYQLIAFLAKEDPAEFLGDKHSGLTDISHFAQHEKTIILTNLLEGLTKNQHLISTHFNVIHQELSAHLKENGHLSEALQAPFQQAFGFALTEDFIRKSDSFYQDLHAEQYAALITDPEAYWVSNSPLLTVFEQVGWPMKDFDRFRSLVQNPVTNDILRTTDRQLLIDLSKNIGLNPNNIFYMNKNSLNWLRSGLNDEKRKAFFKKILNEKPSSFNSCVDAFNLIGSENVDQVVSEPLYTERLLEAIEEFGNITPSLVTAYILNPNEHAQEEYREKVHNFRRDVHHNVPIKPLAEGIGGIDFLADMIAMTFPGTNYEQIKKDLVVLEDRCADIADLKIREKGYQGKIVSGEKIAQLKDENKPIEEGVINLIKVIFADQQEETYLKQGGDVNLAFQGWARLLVEAGATNQEVLFKDNLPEVIACSRVSLGDKLAMFAEKIAGDTSQLSAKNDVLNKAKELFGIYYKDNASEAITLFLEQHQEQARTLLGRLSEKKLNALEKNIANSKSISEESRANFKTIIENLRDKELAEAERTKSLAQLLAFMTERSIFAGPVGLRKKVSKETDKIVLKDKTGQEVDPDLIMTGYLNKNVASYFAKNTAGVCTAGNQELFNRPDHFHVNLVNRKGIVVGNIQGYRLMLDDQPAIIFRGFNPSTSIISATNAEMLCDQMLDMVKQIAKDNNISQVFIPEQDSWHPLSNRVGEGVDKYFVNKFYRPENKVSFPFAITSIKTVNTFYRIS